MKNTLYAWILFLKNTKVGHYKAVFVLKEKNNTEVR